MIEPILPRSKEMRFLRDERPPVRRARAMPVLGTGADEARTFFVESFGCQMNDYDSEFIAERFLEEGYAPAANPESADVLLFNTCAVREGAEERVQKRVQNMAGVKRRRPDMTIAVVGCMAQRLGGAIAVKPGLVDVVAGTDTYRDLPRLVAESRQRVTRAPLVATEL